jgi:hypothetical protein
MHELPGAIRMILAAQDAFRRNAYRAFARYYDFAANFRRMVEEIHGLLDRQVGNVADSRGIGFRSCPVGMTVLESYHTRSVAKE